ncbi:MAG TPA: radical SAM family heme chaperone HemW [Flavitalea sp.]|nr:radical SAM family heme chaperone HemW [Flavitalea sp.]
MAGVYLHIPFCRKACHYCNFHFSTNLKTQNDFIKALLKEIQLRKDYLANAMVSTIYFGGGTPSLLETDELHEIIQEVKRHFNTGNVTEITLEANPDDISDSKLSSWKSAGINRLSIGVQSFIEEDLKWMNRAHTAQQALDSIQRSRKFGFDNLTIDLIYGSPRLTDEAWKKNVEMAIALEIPHISCYALTVEPATTLHQLIAKKIVAPVIVDDQARQFMLLMEWMADAGFEQYEISNFSKPGFRSRHNSSYWDGSGYIGFGPSAHSFNGKERQWNVSNNALYIQAIEKGTIPSDMETLTSAQQLNEYIMTSLRRKEGLSLGYVHEHFNGESEKIRKRSERYITEGKVSVEFDHLVLTREGKLFADGIAADLFCD